MSLILGSCGNRGSREVDRRRSPVSAEGGLLVEPGLDRGRVQRTGPGYHRRHQFDRQPGVDGGIGELLGDPSDRLAVLVDVGLEGGEGGLPLNVMSMTFGWLMLSIVLMYSEVACTELVTQVALTPSECTSG